MSYLRSSLPHNPDFPTVAEELRKLIKRTDEIERESKIAQQKINQYEKDILKLNGRCDAYGRKIEELEGKNLILENRCKATYVHPLQSSHFQRTTHCIGAYYPRELPPIDLYYEDLLMKVTSQ